MSIWILALGLFALVGFLGYLQGALGLAISLVGLILAALLAIPLRSAANPLVSLFGVKSLVWSEVWPPIIVFLAIFFVFLTVASVVHWRVKLHFKYHRDDLTRIRWERLNKRLGLCLGLVSATVWLWLFGLVIHIAGYPIVQLTSETTSTSSLRLLSRAKHDLHDTGLEQWVAASDPMPAKYYEVSDILGLIYCNPALLGRLAQYPPFLTFGDRPEFQEIAKDTEFNNLLTTRGDAGEIFRHARTQAVLGNTENIKEFLTLDLKDLRHFLETGKSPQFDDEKILGRWKLNLIATTVEEMRKRPDIPASVMAQLKQTLPRFLPTVKEFRATTDSKFQLKIETPTNRPPAQVGQAGGTPPAPVVAPPPAAERALPPTSVGGIINRGGRRGGRAQGLAAGGAGGGRGTGAARGAARQAVAPVPVANLQPLRSAEGEWERDGDRYVLTMKDNRGQEEHGQAVSDGERLTLTLAMYTLVFEKAD